jgi:hypothetical protein
MPTYATTPILGADLDAVYPTGTTPPHKLGTQAWGSDGKLYVFAQANASISASDTDCAINTSTFLVAASGGSYTSPATDMVSGDTGWFSKASV